MHSEVNNNIRWAERPRVVESKESYEFCLDDPMWKLNKDIKVSVAWASALTPDIQDSFLNVLAYYAQNFSADHTYNINQRMKEYIKRTGDQAFLVDSMISYRSSLNKEQEHHLGVLKGFICKWHDLGYSGVGKKVIALLEGWRLKGNEKGRAVSLLDPETGPLTDIEMQALLDGLLSQYMSGKLSLNDYTLISILTHSGRRAVQISNLKIKDVIRKKNGAIDEYWVNFPRAKQRHSCWRNEFNAYPIIEDLWLLIDLHIKSIIKKIQTITGLNLNATTVGDLPLFPNYDTFDNIFDENTLNDRLQFDYHHMRRDRCNMVLKKVVPTLGFNSERTGQPLKLTSKRFRYTLGTNLAREGRGEYVIAEALDHTDTQNAGVYVRNIPEFVEFIDKAVAYRLAPLAQAFQGVLIDSEKDAIRGNDIESRIGNEKGNLGSCGSYGFCGAMAPIACYTCKHFQPWVIGPHEAILEELIKKRAEILVTTKDPKIAAVNDRLILAVSDVILRCNRHKAAINKKGVE